MAGEKSKKSKDTSSASTDLRKPFLEAREEYCRVLADSHQKAHEQAREDWEKHVDGCQQAQEKARQGAEEAHKDYRSKLQRGSGEEAQRSVAEAARTLADRIHDIDSELGEQLRNLEREHEDLVRSRIDEIRSREEKAWHGYLESVKTAWGSIEAAQLDAPTVAVIADTILGVAHAESASRQAVPRGLSA